MWNVLARVDHVVLLSGMDGLHEWFAYNAVSLKPWLDETSTL